MPAGAMSGAAHAIAVAASLVALLATARAQDIRITAPASQIDDDAAQEKPLTPEESALLEKALTYDPLALNSTASAPRALHKPSLSKPKKLEVSRSDKPDGSSTMTVKKPIAPEWDAKIGADVNLAAAPATTYRPGEPLPSRAAGDRGAGAAWASVGVVPDFATVDARLDPAAGQSRVGTTLRHSVPIGDQLSVTLQESASLTETYALAPGASGLPAAAPAPTGPSRVWANEHSAKLDVLPTGTSFGAAVSSASNDPVTHNSLSAEQKIPGGLHVRTAVSEIGQPTPNKSISAGFKLTW